jgi:RNA polymerase sigma factor (sigma-70 family)
MDSPALAIKTENTHIEDGIIKQAVAKNRSRLIDFIRRRIPEEFDAEDIAQDVFYELVESYRLMRPVEQLASWLFTVARNKITDLYRKKRTVSLEEELRMGDDDDDGGLLLADLLDSGDAAPEAVMMREAAMEAIEEALDDLPEEQRDAFVMNEIEGMKFEDMSAITGVPVKTLISRKRYAVIYLRQKLQDLYSEIINQ